jgi:hyaluronan synthase
VASKRNAARIGVEMASGEVVVLLDSETIWTEGTLAELLKPFTDPPAWAA